MTQQIRPPAITWLASYPRSGNTLLRTILKRCFGQPSQSLYTDQEFPESAVRELVGHQAAGSNPKAFVREALDAGRTLYVKTHELPGSDAHPVLYVVRDGRSALVSHHHYLKEIMGRDISLAEVIEGQGGESWSRHVTEWTARGNALVVRYEDLAAGKETTLQAIARFIGQPLIHAFDISFSQLHALSPVFFRGGSDAANIAEMDAAALSLFEQRHGETLRRLGYGA